MNPHEQTVNGERVTMEVLGEAYEEPPREVPQIPININADLLSEDGSFIPFSSFLVRYRRPALCDDDLRTAHRALENLYHKTRLRVANSDEGRLSAEKPERTKKESISDTGSQDVSDLHSQLPPRRRAASLRERPGLITLSIVLFFIVIILLATRYLH